MCENGFPEVDGSKMHSTMICFTDTPLEHSLEHCQRYNYFGISFNKDEMIEMGANPVLYLVEKRKDYQKNLKKIQHEVLPKKWGGFETYVPIDVRYNLSWFLSVTQPYKTLKVEEKGFAEYLEREWRIIRALPYHNESKLIKTNFDIKEINCEWNDKKEVLSWECYLSFNPNIIEKIIVTKGYEERARKLIKKYNLKCSLQIVTKTKLKSRKYNNTKQIVRKKKIMNRQHSN